LIDLTSSGGVELKKKRKIINLVDESDDEEEVLKKTSHTKKCRKLEKKFVCPVCFEDILPEEGHGLSECGHAFCFECLQGHISSKLSERQVSHLFCPDPNCQKMKIELESQDIRACTIDAPRGKNKLENIRLWQNYQHQATQTLLENEARDDSKPMRRCPGEHCNYIFSYSKNRAGLGTLFICPECDQAFCLGCPVVQGSVGPAHDGGCRTVLAAVKLDALRQKKLEEWKKENAQADHKFQQLLRAEAKQGKTKPCPKCHTPITKNAGCDHMRCTMCHFDYNWSTGLKVPFF